MIRRPLVLVLLSLPAAALIAYEDGPRLAWDYSATRPVSAGVYARMIPLPGTGTWLMAYSEGPAIQVRTGALEEDAAFAAPRQVAVHPGYDSTNAELVRLENGWILLAYNTRPRSPGSSLPYEIRTIISRDDGRTWSDDRVAYTAGTTAGVGCWEPAMLQLPDGEVLLFFANEAPYPSTSEQEIGRLRSTDHGLTWGNYTTTSFRPGSRDGMPVPLLLADGATIVHAIEDNGLSGGRFKPAIISSAVSDRWSSGSVDGNSPRRWGALRVDAALPAGIYAGAPYLARLAAGELVLSVQSTEGRPGGDHSYSAPRVYLGNGDAKDFARGSTPMPWLPVTAAANWNSVAALSARRVALMSSVRGVATPFGSEAIWMAVARILPPLDIAEGTIRADGALERGEWTSEDDAPIFVGSHSPTHLVGQARWDSTHLHVLCSVQDEHVWSDTLAAGNGAADDDAVELLLELPGSSPGQSAAWFKVLVEAGGETQLQRADELGGWTTWTAHQVAIGRAVDGTLNAAAGIDAGYRIEISIPWLSVGGRPAIGSGWGFHVRLYEDADGGPGEWIEEMGGNDPLRATTWSRATLRQAATPPEFTRQPTSQAVALGSTTVLEAAAEGAASYQWYQNGTPLAGANQPRLELSGIVASQLGEYRLRAGNAHGLTDSAVAVVSSAPAMPNPLVNLSSRTPVADGSGVQIAGFVVNGTQKKRVLVRAGGPALAQYQVANVLPDPVLTLFRGAEVVAFNDDWGTERDARTIAEGVGAGTFAEGSRDAAIVAWLSPGAYTAQVRGKDGAGGVALVEVFVADRGPTASRLVNLSTRSLTGALERTQIAGFFVTGSEPKRFLIRAAGPWLDRFGVAGYDEDPVLVLYQGGTEIARNDDWGVGAGEVAAAARLIGLAGFDVDSRDAALVASLAPGGYTAHVNRKGTADAVALVEVYELPD